MLFAFYGFDKSHSARLRVSKLSAHLDYLKSTPAVKLSGPLLDDTGQMIGTLLVLEAENRPVAEAWLTDEPFFRAGLFAEFRLVPWLNMLCSLEKR